MPARGHGRSDRQPIVRANIRGPQAGNDVLARHQSPREECHGSEIANRCRKGGCSRLQQEELGGRPGLNGGWVVLDEVGTQRKIRGVGAVLDAYHGWANAFPDSKATINSAFANGSSVTLELTWRGTHTGPRPTPAGEIPATGKKFVVRACQVVEVTKDKVKATRHYFDMTTLLQQLGVMS
ncbi:MAG: ester cyclase [Vicinamibacterales bacterium]